MVSTTPDFQAFAFGSSPMDISLSAPSETTVLDQADLNDEYLLDVSINGVQVNNVRDLLELGQSRRICTSKDAHPDASLAFTHDHNANDMEYFSALLAARSEMRRALTNKIQGLMSMRKRNKQLARQRAIRVRSANKKTNGIAKRKTTNFTTKTGAKEGNPTAADARQGDDDNSEMNFTGSTTAADGSVGNGWHAVNEEGNIICASPLSDEGTYLLSGAGTKLEAERKEELLEKEGNTLPRRG